MYKNCFYFIYLYFWIGNIQCKPIQENCQNVFNKVKTLQNAVSYVLCNYTKINKHQYTEILKKSLTEI